MRILFLSALAFGLSLATSAIASELEKTVEIPLKEIWAFRMPDTQDVMQLDNQRVRPLVEEIQTALRKDSTGPGFVVSGTGVEALRKAHAVLTSDKWEDPNQPVQAGEILTLVFYSRLSARFVWVNNVSRDGNTITVKYEAITHESRDLTMHFALIPLGQLPAGRYKVKLVELPTITPVGTAAKKVPEIVCKPFSFDVLAARR